MILVTGKRTGIIIIIIIIIRNRMRKMLNDSPCEIILSIKMHYTYVLLSKKDEKYYIGYSKNLKLRFKQHQDGKVTSTKNRRPFKLIYYSPSEMLQEAIPIHRDYFTG